MSATDPTDPTARTRCMAPLRTGGNCRAFIVEGTGRCYRHQERPEKMLNALGPPPPNRAFLDAEIARKVDETERMLDPTPRAEAVDKVMSIAHFAWCDCTHLCWTDIDRKITARILSPEHAPAVIAALVAAGRLGYVATNGDGSRVYVSEPTP